MDPYYSSKENFHRMSKVESPMVKLELIYKASTSSIQKDIESFWINHLIESQRLTIDVDNL